MRERYAVYVYEEWLPSALCGAARGCICDMYTQTHLEEEGGKSKIFLLPKLHVSLCGGGGAYISQQQTIAVRATVRLRLQKTRESS